MRIIPLASILIVVVTASPASADQAPAAAGKAGPVSFAAVGGAAIGSHDAGAAVGATIAYDFTDRVSLEGRGVFLDRGPGASALDLNASVLVHLLDNRKANPYVAVGGGLYRAMFDLGDNDMFGVMSANVPAGSRFVMMENGDRWTMMPAANATTAAPIYNNRMPAYYAQRMGSVAVPADRRWGGRNFTDPALSFGGGVLFDVTRSLYVRPDVRAVMIVGDGDTFTIGSATFSVGYRF